MDRYGVTPPDVAAQVPALFPQGFSEGTRPAVATVVGLITSADTMAQMTVRKATGREPADTDAAAPIARQYIIAWTLAQVMQAVYAGQDPARVKDAVSSYWTTADGLRSQLEGLGFLAAGDAPVQNRVRGDDTSSGPMGRELLITDCDLGAGARRSRRF